MKFSRRTLLQGAAVMAAPSLSLAGAAAQPASLPNDDAARLAGDEAFWREVAKSYDVKRDIINLENGNWGVMARPVMERYRELTQMVNHDNSYYARRQYGEDITAVQAQLAEALGAAPEEIALTRGATEALKALIAGYNKLSPGDAVMYADLDYGSMQAMMDWRAKQSGGDVVRLAIPEPATRDGLIDFYRQAIADHPAVRLLLLTHVSHRTGLVMPIREIVAMARAAGVDCIVDAAHSWGQMNFKVGDLGADFVGFNLHKWIGAPVGVGAAYIRSGRLADIDPDPGAGDWEQDKISGRVHTGTANFAAYLSVPAALDFHRQIGPDAKAARLAHLRNIWVHPARAIPGLDILTPDDPALHAGITSFRRAGKGTPEDNIALAARLLDDFNIYTVHRTGVAAGACVRATPSLYNSEADAAALTAALTQIQKDRP